MDAIEPPKTGVLRCSPVANVQLPWFRSKKGADGSSSPVELGNTVEVAGGFATSQLRSGASLEAAVLWFDERGQEVVVELGRVHGAVEPPQLLAVGKDLIVALSDSDASRTTIRLARIRSVSASPQVTWGPEVRVERSEDSSYSLASAVWERGVSDEVQVVLLAWDEHERASLLSRIHLLPVEIESMKSAAVERIISAPREDAVHPLLVPGHSATWALWMTYGSSKAPTEAPTRQAELVEGPPVRLNVRRLGRRGQQLGAPIALSADNTQVLVYDAVALREQQNHSLLVAHRASMALRPMGGSPIATSVVGVDGSITSGNVEHADLGPSAPQFLRSGQDGSTWLVARGAEQEVLLGEVDSSARISQFAPERGLEGKIPLLRRKSQLLAMEAVGMDLKFSLSDCVSNSK